MTGDPAGLLRWQLSGLEASFVLSFGRVAPG